MKSAEDTKETGIIPSAAERVVAEPAPKENAWKRFKTGCGQRFRTMTRFSSELWNEHEFWINTAAVKGGATAVGLAGMAVLSYVVALPAALAVSGAIVAATMIGLGGYGVVSGGIFVVDHIRAAYRRVTGKEPLAPRKHLREKIRENAFVKKMAGTKFGQKILKSQAWKIAKKISHKQDALMQGLALGGSLTSITLGAILIASQVTVMPIVLVGAGIAMTTYMTVRGVIDHVRIQKEKRTAADAPKLEKAGEEPAAAANIENETKIAPRGETPTLAARFRKWTGIGCKEKPAATPVAPGAPIPQQQHLTA
jgi:hypothetical protein